MSGVAWWLLQNAAVATALALVLVLVVRWTRPRPALEHALWLLVAAKFVLPPLAVVALPDLVVPTYLESIADRTRAATAAMVGLGGQSAESIAAPAGARDGSMPTEAPLAPRSEREGGAALAPGAGVSSAEPTSLPFFGPSRVRTLALLWLALALAALCWRLLRHGLWLRRLAREDEEPPADLAARVARGAARIGVRPPRVRMTAAVTSPLVAGLREPVLYWPRELIGVLSVERMDTIVAHELAHLRRHDLWSGMLELTVDCLWRWYPGWRLVRRRMRDAAERACDLVVVETYPDRRRQYAEGILDVLTLDARRRRSALALGVDGPGSVERRIERILRPPRSGGRRFTAYVAIAVVAAAVLPAWAPASTGDARIVDAAGPTSSGATERTQAAPRFAGVISRGEVRWDDAERLPSLQPGGWLIAFGAHDGVMRRLELRRSAGGGGFVRYVVDGSDAPLDAGVAAWLRDVFERTTYDVGTARTNGSSSAAWVPDGPHVHRTDGSESLAYWAATDAGVRTDGTLDHDVDEDRPVYLVSARDSTVEFFSLAHEDDGVRVLEHSIGAAAAATDAAAEHRARAALERVANWILRPQS
ncbi:MAG TPA: M56 family metallopeptidase [Longimicrobiales bacterium]|nr:M56 family metallopeptidase [Longimicrobiales bacterium]